MPKRSIKKALLMLCVMSAAAAAAGNSETDSVLAAVNGDPITLGEILPAVRERELQLRSAYSGKALEQEILKLRYHAVEELINQKLAVADFHDQQLVIPPQEIEYELDRWGTYIGCHSRRELEERVKKSGSSLKKLRQQILTRMIVQIMRRREYLLAAPPSPREIFQRFKREEKKLSFPGSVELSLLRLPLKEKEKIKQVKNSLAKNPAQWEQFAEAYAITPGKNGHIGAVDLDKLRPEFARAMKKIQTGHIYSGIKTSDGVYFIKVLKYAPPRKAEFKEYAEKMKKTMENEIYQKSSAGYAKRLRDKAVIEYFFPVPEGVKKK